MKLTPWFPPEVKPVYVGWYHTGFLDLNPRNYNSESLYNWWWDGKYWRSVDNGDKSAYQNRYWRGLAEKP